MHIVNDIGLKSNVDGLQELGAIKTIKKLTHPSSSLKQNAVQVVYFLCPSLELVITIHLPNNIVNCKFEIHCCYSKFGWSL
jgi:hypothetical protein